MKVSKYFISDFVYYWPYQTITDWHLRKKLTGTKYLSILKLSSKVYLKTVCSAIYFSVIGNPLAARPYNVICWTFPSVSHLFITSCNTVRQDLSISVLDIVGQIIYVVSMGAVLCIVGYLAASLACTYYMPVAPATTISCPSSCDNH